MRIAVMGAGGQGGLFGGLLRRAGEDVVLIARGANLKAIRSGGLTLKTGGCRAFIPDIDATDEPSEVGPVGLLIFCVKTYHFEVAAQDSQPLVGSSTVVLPVQNGIDAADRLARFFGGDKVIGGVSYHQAALEAPGVITYGGVSGKLYIGELGGGSSARVCDIQRTLDGAGIDCQVHSDIRIAMWEKLILVCATGGVMAYYRRPIGSILDDPDGRALILGVMEEAEQVARAKGIELPADTAQRTLHFIESNMGPDTKSSQLEDLLAGRRLELEALNGEIIRLARKTGVPAPLNSRVYEALKPYAGGSDR
jgi:2-dehydropantoate 2-reductase